MLFRWKDNGEMRTFSMDCPFRDHSDSLKIYSAHRNRSQRCFFARLVWAFYGCRLQSIIGGMYGLHEGEKWSRPIQPDRAWALGCGSLLLAYSSGAIDHKK